jgi:hypothetical protein
MSSKYAALLLPAGPHYFSGVSSVTVRTAAQKQSSFSLFDFPFSGLTSHLCHKSQATKTQEKQQQTKRLDSPIYHIIYPSPQQNIITITMSDEDESYSEEEEYEYEYSDGEGGGEGGGADDVSMDARSQDGDGDDDGVAAEGDDDDECMTDAAAGSNKNPKKKAAVSMTNNSNGKSYVGSNGKNKRRSTGSFDSRRRSGENPNAAPMSGGKFDFDGKNSSLLPHFHFSLLNDSVFTHSLSYSTSPH